MDVEEMLGRALGKVYPCGATTVITSRPSAIGDDDEREYVLTCNRRERHDGPHEHWFGFARWGGQESGGSE